MPNKLVVRFVSTLVVQVEAELKSSKERTDNKQEEMQREHKAR